MKKLIEIDTIRICDDPKYGTFGVMKKGAIPFCCTLELPWKNNAKKISRIPAGQYLCTRHFSNRLKAWTFLLNNVPFREGVLVHCANLAEQLEGCIAVGNGYDDIVLPDGRKGPGISSSKQAFFELLAATLNQQSWYLNIIDRITK